MSRVTGAPKVSTRSWPVVRWRSSTYHLDLMIWACRYDGRVLGVGSLACIERNVTGLALLLYKTALERSVCRQVL